MYLHFWRDFWWNRKFDVIVCVETRFFFKSGHILRIIGHQFCESNSGTASKPGHNCWPGSDHMRRKIKKARSGSTTTAATAMFPSWVMPTFWSNDIYLLQMHGEPIYFFLCICMQQLLFTACSEPHPLICFCCRSSTPVVCQGIFTCSRLYYS